MNIIDNVKRLVMLISEAEAMTIGTIAKFGNFETGPTPEKPQIARA